MEAPESTCDLSARLDRVRAMLRRYLLINTPWLPGVADGPSGRALVAFLMGRPGVEAESPQEIAALDAALAGSGAELPDSAVVIERFEQLRRGLPIADRDCDALWVLLAPEFDLRFLAAYRLAWSAPSQRHCDEDFLLAMLAPHGPYRVRGLFEDSHSPLLTLGLVDLVPNSAGVATYQPSRRLVNHLGGMSPELAMRGSPVSLSRGEAVAVWDGFDLAGPLRAALSERSAPSSPLVVVEAARLASVDVAVAQYAADPAHGAEPLLVSLDLAEHVEEEGGEESAAPRGAEEAVDLLRQTLREARLAQGLVHVRGGERLAALSHEALRHVASLLRGARGLVVVECQPTAPSRLLVELTRPPADVCEDHAGRVVMLTMPTPSGKEREILWHYLHERLGRSQDSDLPALAEVPCELRTMEQALRVSALAERPLVEVVRSLVALRLPRFARRVEVTLGWHQVILPEETLDQMRQVRALAANHERIMDTWGLSTRGTGRGVKVLFSGPSGTGKTLAAGLLAKDARCELYQVDVSALMSKWVGETEKHLAALFREAQASGSALLFDEADALFRQRSSGGDGGERFGTQIVNFLLEAIERFDGMIILTSNFDSAIDTAFARRLSYHIRFRPPEAAQRADLWRLHLPASLPLAPGLDIDRLGGAYELTGGEIYKAAIRAAAVTLERGASRVGLSDIEDAVRSLYAEKGRLPPARSGASPA